MTSVEYIAPLGKSWDRARNMLFRPFRLEIWLVLGFAAFLSGLGSGGGGSANWGQRFANGSDVGPRIHDFLHRPLVLALVVSGTIALLILGIILAWVGARGLFIFLDGVLNERAEIVAPWKRYAHLGNSLFGLQLLVGAGTILFFLILFGPTLVSVLGGIWKDGTIPDLHIFGLVVRGLIGAPVFLLVAVFQVLTRHFVVPVMWKHDLRVVVAWKRLWPLVKGNPGAFLVYLLLLFALYVALSVAMVVVGFATCCIGFLLLALPYVSSVILLPVHVTIRGFGPEFLAQFGAEWDARPPRGGPAEPLGGPPVPPGGLGDSPV